MKVRGSAETGRKKLRWAEEHMRVLQRVWREELSGGAMEGERVSMALHPEAKTCVLARYIALSGATVRLVACNPYSTDDDVVAALLEDSPGGLEVMAWRGESEEEYRRALLWSLRQDPTLILDDGGDLTEIVVNRPGEFTSLKGISEETTTGVVRARAFERAGRLKVPLMDVNGAMMKRLFDNRHGTGQSTLEGVLRTTNLLIAGKRVVVAGYGHCGRGIAMRMRGMGARVAVTEVDPVRAAEALLDGFDVGRMQELLEDADMVITATGMKDVVGERHIGKLKDGVILANAGHFNVEISLEALKKASKAVREVREGVKEYTLADGRRVFLLAEGRLVNLVGGQGHPVEIMDLSFSLQALSLLYLKKNYGKLAPGVHPLPEELDRRVAHYFLKAMGKEIDQLTEDQVRYIEEG